MSYVPAVEVYNSGTITGNFKTKDTWGPGTFTHSGCRAGQGCDKGRQYENGRLGYGSCGCYSGSGTKEFRYTCLQKSYDTNLCNSTFPVRGTVTGGDYVNPMSIQIGGCDAGSHKVQQYCTYSSLTNVGDVFGTLSTYFNEPDATNIKRSYCNNIDFYTLANNTECSSVINRDDRINQLIGINWHLDPNGISKFKSLCDGSNNNVNAQNVLKSKIQGLPTNITWSRELITMLNSLYDDDIYHDSAQNIIQSYCRTHENDTACSCYNAVYKQIDGCTSNTIPGCETGSLWNSYFKKPTASETVKNTIRQFYKPVCMSVCSAGEANAKGILRAATVSQSDNCPNLNIQSCGTQILTGGSLVKSQIEASCNFPSGSLGDGMTLQEIPSGPSVVTGGNVQDSTVNSGITNSGNIKDSNGGGVKDSNGGSIKESNDGISNKYLIGGGISFLVFCCCCVLLILMFAL